MEILKKFALRKKAKAIGSIVSVLAGNAMVESEVKNVVVTLNGEEKKEKVEKMLQSIHQLPVAGIVNNLTVK